MDAYKRARNVTVAVSSLLFAAKDFCRQHIRFQIRVASYVQARYICCAGVFLLYGHKQRYILADVVNERLERKFHCENV